MIVVTGNNDYTRSGTGSHAMAIWIDRPARRHVDYVECQTGDDYDEVCHRETSVLCRIGGTGIRGASR